MKTITLIDKPVAPDFGDYDILYCNGIDEDQNYYELVFTDTNGKAGELESVCDVSTAVHLDPKEVILERKELLK